ncbi:hypothetical protein FQZ97_793330 [compost metagenome]
MLAEGGHGGTGLAIDHDGDMAFGRAGGDRRAFQGREHWRQTFTRGLVASGTAGVVGLLTAGQQLIHAPFLAGQLLLGRSGGLALGQPDREIFLRLGLDHHRHEAMILAAQLGALATENPWLVDARPGFVDKAGDGVFLYRQGRHPPGMDHIGSGNQEAHLGADRHHQRLIDLQQVVLAFNRLVVDLRGRRGQVAEELDVLTQVFVVPFPLVASDLDIQLGFRTVVDIDQGLGRRNGHQHQNHQGHYGPENLHRGAFVEVRGLLPRGAAVDQHRPEHGAEHHHADHHADPEDGHVQVKN